MMQDAGFIVSSYVVTFGSVLLYAWYVLRWGKKATEQLPDDSKPWL